MPNEPQSVLICMVEREFAVAGASCFISRHRHIPRLIIRRRRMVGSGLKIQLCAYLLSKESFIE